MSEHPRKIVVLASVLKPVDDTRMYEKFAQSLEQANKYEINIIGFYSKNIPAEEYIQFHPLFNFKRLSMARVFAPLKFLKKLIQLKPQIVVVHTHELLWAAVLFRIIHRCKLIYDIRENYGLNILQNKGYSALIRPLLSTYVRVKENLLSPFIHHFFLAEKAYADELGFLGRKHTFLLNKFKKLPGIVASIEKGLLVYTGTIAENYGIFETIELSKNLHQLDQKIRLKIVGYSAHSPTLDQVKSQIENYSFIELIGGDHLVPHSEILKHVASAEFAFVPHRLDPSIVNCFPTKIYEYLAFQKPMIMRNHEPWIEYAHKYRAAIPTNFEEDPSILLEQMRSVQFYPNGVDEDIYWDEAKLNKVMDRLSS